MTTYYYIWYEIYENEKLISRDRYPTGYKYKHNAVRRAKQMWSEDFYMPLTDSLIHREWIVSQTNPWEEDILND